MTDREMFTAMLDRAMDANDVTHVERDYMVVHGAHSITLNAWFNRAAPFAVIRGYTGFLAEFEFDANGAFKCVGIWE